jgi:hypothetical protein
VCASSVCRVLIPSDAIRRCDSHYMTRTGIEPENTEPVGVHYSHVQQPNQPIPFQVVESGGQVLFSLETLIITVSAGAVAALVVGFVTGYCCGRRCRKDGGGGGIGGDGVHVPFPDTEYEYFEQRANLARPTLMQQTIMQPTVMQQQQHPHAQMGPGAPLLGPKVNYQEEVCKAEL